MREHTYHHHTKQFALMALTQQLHSTNHDGFEFATALVQPLWDVLKWLQHFLVKNPTECIHRQTIYAATMIHIYAGNPTRLAYRAQAYGINKVSFSQ